MINFTCPECDKELEEFKDGLICHDCHVYVDSGQLVVWKINRFRYNLKANLVLLIKQLFKTKA